MHVVMISQGTYNYLCCLNLNVILEMKKKTLTLQNRSVEIDKEKRRLHRMARIFHGYSYVVSTT